MVTEATERPLHTLHSEYTQHDNSAAQNVKYSINNSGILDQHEFLPVAPQFGWKYFKSCFEIP